VVKIIIEFILKVFGKQKEVVPTLPVGNQNPAPMVMAPEMPVVKPPPKPVIHPTPYELAREEIGVTELGSPKRVIQYHEATTLDKKYHSPKTSWCSSFMSWCFTGAGVGNPRSAWARDWLGYGEKISLDQAKPGDVLIFQRDGDGDGEKDEGHVTFFSGYDPVTKMIKCLGGNQSNAVRLSNYSKDDLIGVRRFAYNG
jgi:uncharacterized protein (TIGR02594 family)